MDVRELYLRKKHISDLKKAIIDSGLNPDDFAFDKQTYFSSEYRIDFGITVLRHIPSDSFLSFDYRGSSFSTPASKRKPGLNSPIETKQYFKDWQEQLAYVKEWLDILREEIEAIDWFEILKKEKELIQSSIATSDENAKFTDAEKSVISARVEEIKQVFIKSLVEKNLPANEHNVNIVIINNSFNYIVESSDRIGRKDWLILAIGIVQTLAFSSEARQTVGKLLKGLAEFVLGAQHLLN